MTEKEFNERSHVLPKWARDYVQHLHSDLFIRAQKDKAHAILTGTGDWFTLIPRAGEDFHLYRFYADFPQPLCSIGEGDVVLIGRKRKVRCIGWETCPRPYDCPHAFPHKPNADCEEDNCPGSDKPVRCV